MLYSIFTNDIGANIDLIERIKDFLQKQDNIIDFVIFTDEINDGFANYSILTSFYMIAYAGKIVFLNTYDYLTYKNIIKNDAILYMSYDNLQNTYLSNLEDCSILTDHQNLLQWVPRS